MRIQKLWLATIAALWCNMMVSAHDLEVDGIYYNITSSTDLTAAVTYKGLYYDSDSNTYSGDVSIPPTISYNSKNYRVTSIGRSAFSGCSNLTSISIPNSVTSIESSAFSDCINLTSVTIPESVTSIAWYAFDGCSSLTSIVIPESVKRIEYSTFSGCNSLTSITIPEGVTSIECNAFNGTAWYNKQPDGVVYAGNVLYAYKGEMPENTSIEVREGTISITSKAFYGCHNLISITIPEGVTEIGDYAFEGCTRLDSIVLPESLTSVGAGAIGHYTDLATIPNNITHIGDYAFPESQWYWNQPEGAVYVGKVLYGYKGDKSAITDFVVQEGTTQIYRGVFQNCTNLSSITIPSSVAEVGAQAFEGCTGLTAVYIDDLSAWCKIDFADNGFGFHNIRNPLSYAHSLYLRGEKITELIIPDDVTEIKGCNFSEGDFTSVTIHSGVKSIGPGVFYGCSSLTAVHISDLVAWGDIEYGPFAPSTVFANPLRYAHCLYLNGEKITELVIPDGLIRIKDDAFAGCDITSVKIPNSVISIGEEAFADCVNLTDVKIPNNITNIEEGAFRGCIYNHRTTKTNQKYPSVNL